MGYTNAEGCEPSWPTDLSIGLAHIYSLLGLAVTKPFLAKTAV
jgi:hypothetical protein